MTFSITNNFYDMHKSIQSLIIEFCLTTKEQIRILKKCGINYKGHNSYEIFEFMLTNLDINLKLSKRIDFELNRKFFSKCKIVGDIKESEACRYLSQSFENGEYKFAIWFCLVSFSNSDEMKKRLLAVLFDSLHCGMEKLSLIEQDVSEKKFKIKFLKKSLKEKIKEDNLIKRKNIFLEDENRKLTQILENIETCGKSLLNSELKKVQTLTDDLNLIKDKSDFDKKLLIQKINDLKKENKEVRKNNKQLVKELNEKVDYINYYNSCISNFKTEKLQENLSEEEDEDKCLNCPKNSSCSVWKKRILLVGGITRMEHLYRELVENQGGVFDYHDGYIQKGNRIEPLIKKADMVICPVTCNSHGACLKAKALCKKHSVPVHMISSAGLGAVASVIKS